MPANLFRPGRGDAGERPPNDWRSVFGGEAWSRVIEADGTPGEWYLHLFDVTQPDLDWQHPEVRAEFVSVLRFLARPRGGRLRVDVAHGLVRQAGLPDWPDRLADQPRRVGRARRRCAGQPGAGDGPGDR